MKILALLLPSCGLGQVTPTSACLEGEMRIIINETSPGSGGLNEVTGTKDGAWHTATVQEVLILRGDETNRISDF